MQNSVLNYIQLALLFLNGFLISRLFIKCGIAEKIVFAFIKRSRGRISLIFIYLLFTVAAISLFIPNVISALAILPLLEILKKDFSRVDEHHRTLNTSLAMGNLYGANIGGSGSITGSPAHMMLVGFLLLKNVQGTGRINFLSWLGWGLPFVIFFSAIACCMIVLLLIPRQLRRRRIDFEHVHTHREDYPHEKSGLTVCLVAFFFWLGISFANLFEQRGVMIATTIISATYTVSFLVLVFFIRMRDHRDEPASSLLTIRDCFSNLPSRGLLLLLAALVISTLMISLKVDRQLAVLVSRILPPEPNRFLITLVLVTATVLISEFISNTATAFSFFLIALSVSSATGFAALPLLMGISVVSNVPSMSPIASPVNAIAYGGLKGISLRRMMLLGLMMDLVGAFLVTLLAVYVFPWYYGTG